MIGSLGSPRKAWVFNCGRNRGLPLTTRSHMVLLRVWIRAVRRRVTARIKNGEAIAAKESSTLTTASGASATTAAKASASSWRSSAEHFRLIDWGVLSAAAQIVRANWAVSSSLLAEQRGRTLNYQKTCRLAIFRAPVFVVRGPGREKELGEFFQWLGPTCRRRRNVFHQCE